MVTLLQLPQRLISFPASEIRTLESMGNHILETVQWSRFKGLNVHEE